MANTRSYHLHPRLICKMGGNKYFFNHTGTILKVNKLTTDKMVKELKNERQPHMLMNSEAYKADGARVLL